MQPESNILKWHKKIAKYSLLNKLGLISAAKFEKKYEKLSEQIYTECRRLKQAAVVRDSGWKLSPNKIIILTSGVLVYIAKCIESALRSFNFETEIKEQYDDAYGEFLHIVLAPMQFAKDLPPHYIAVQMEQTISERWFTPDYIAALENALAVLDYSALNLEYLAGRNIAAGRTFYVPIAPLPALSRPGHAKKTPLLFYGDFRCERRQNMLDKLSERFEIKRLIDVYREEMERELDDAGIIINIHYYAGAMLETTRISEAVSHNCLVLSETSVNDDEYPILKEVVDFVPVDDVDAMAARIEYWMSHPSELKERIERNKLLIEKLYNQFSFSLGRVLFHLGAVNFETLCRAEKDSLTIEGDKVTLCFGDSVPSIRAGKEPFVISHPDLGVSRAATYAFVARCALSKGAVPLTVEEMGNDTCAYDAEALELLAQHKGLCDSSRFEELFNSLHQKNT